MGDQFDVPLTEQEKCEIAAMPSHEVYLLTLMTPRGSVRARELRELYVAVLDADFAPATSTQENDA